MYGLIDVLLEKIESVVNQPSPIITMADKLLSRIVSGEEAHACYDIHCQWNDQCYNEPGGWHTDYKAKVCLTNCGYWYDTGQRCCYRTSPGSC